MMSNARRVTVVGGGISGAACANVLAAAGVQVTLRDRGRRLGGRMASRMLRDTGTAHDGRPVDIGASYFTAREPEFVAQVDQWTAAGVVRPWTDSFHVAGPEGIEGVRSGPMRFAAPRGLRSVVESMIDARVEVRSGDDVTELPSDEPVALCMPVPQARRLDDRIPDSSITSVRGSTSTGCSSTTIRCSRGSLMTDDVVAMTRPCWSPTCTRCCRPGTFRIPPPWCRRRWLRYAGCWESSTTPRGSTLTAGPSPSRSRHTRSPTG